MSARVPAIERGAGGHESGLCLVCGQIDSRWGAVGFPIGVARVHVGA